MQSIAILYRKEGNEKEIALASAEKIFDALIKLKYRPTRIPFSEEMDIKIFKSFDVVLNLVYGPYGEDGILATIFQQLNTPFVSPSATNCLLTFNKLITKKILNFAGIRTPKQSHRPPLICKPMAGGSSDEVILIKTKDELNEYRKRINSKHSYLFEEYLNGREFCATAIRRNGRIIQLPIAEIKKEGAIFNKKEKYGGFKKCLDIPAKIDKDLQRKIEDTCQDCFKILNCNIYAKVDLILDSENRINVIEMDGIPGFGPYSALTKTAECYGISFEELINILIDETIENFRKL